MLTTFTLTHSHWAESQKRWVLVFFASGWDLERKEKSPSSLVQLYSTKLIVTYKHILYLQHTWLSKTVRTQTATPELAHGAVLPSVILSNSKILEDITSRNLPWHLVDPLDKTFGFLQEGGRGYIINMHLEGLVWYIQSLNWWGSARRWCTRCRPRQYPTCPAWILDQFYPLC